LLIASVDSLNKEKEVDFLIANLDPGTAAELSRLERTGKPLKLKGKKALLKDLYSGEVKIVSHLEIKIPTGRNHLESWGIINRYPPPVGGVS
jgi:hypothetical protein